MNLDDNIKNAFEIVRKTYENLDKLMVYLDNESTGKGYKPSIGRFLRYSSDPDHRGWLYNNIIKLYQFIDDEDLHNKWKDGPIYSVEFSFENYPKMIVSKFDFNIKEWSPGIGAHRVNYFSYPVNKDFKSEFRHMVLEDSKEYTKSVPNDDISEKYWGLNHVIFREFKLTEVNLENANKLVFDEFDKMRNIKE